MKNKILIAIFSLSFLSSCGQETQQKQIIETKNTTMKNKMKIEIWSDVMCPFCYIGKRNFETALSQFQHRDKVEVEWKSFQLAPSMAENPPHQDNLYKFVSELKGIPYEQCVQMHQGLIQSAKAVGLEYNFDKAKITNSLKAHRVIQFAKTKGLGEKVEERFFKAYFTDGKNVSESATLIELSKEIGLTESEVNEAITNPKYKERVTADVKEAQMLGARGVPFFVIDRKYAIAGSQQPNEILQSLEKAFNEWEKENPIGLEIKNGAVCKPNGECD